MVNNIPETWKYSSDMEMLLLFYQCTDEMMSEQTADTYALPLHNTMTLVLEAEEVYGLLKDYNLIETYYAKYIPPIIDEFIDSIEQDYLLKKRLGKRIQNIKTGFVEAKENHVLLERWISLIKQACNMGQYKNMYKEEIERLIINTIDKNRLIYCIKNYYTCLINFGYSREHIYISGKKFFDNKNITINNKKQIKDFLNIFNGQRKKYEFILLMDTGTIDYIEDISDNISFMHGSVEKIDVKKERDELCKDYSVEKLIGEYDVLVDNAAKHAKVEVVKYSDDSKDPYMSIIKLKEHINFLQNFKRYFIHFDSYRQIHRVLVKKEDGYYTELRIPQKMHKRPYIKQDVIDMRIKNILQGRAMAFSAFESIMQAIEMHAEAIDSKNTSTLLRTFWTSLETLFSNPIPNSTRENVVNSVLPILQKTYILKVMRGLYFHIVEAASPLEMAELGIDEFEEFVKFFATFDADSKEMKEIYTLLADNPLLRGRLYETRMRMSDGKHITKYLETHSKRIEWQLKRIYRIRNITTHLGKQVRGMDVLMNHLHNYFDYAVNYMICKSENNDSIISTSAVVSEAKNDNSIHYELLKSNEKLSDDNYLEYLFGPDHNILHYKFEF